MRARAIVASGKAAAAAALFGAVLGGQWAAVLALVAFAASIVPVVGPCAASALHSAVLLITNGSTPALAAVPPAIALLGARLEPSFYGRAKPALAFSTVC